MFKLLGWMVKVTLFAAAVLILGNIVRIKGRTLSDQVRTEMAHAEKSEIATRARKLAGQITEDAREGYSGRIKAGAAPAKERDAEEFFSSERQKLKALIQELNRTTGSR